MSQETFYVYLHGATCKKIVKAKRYNSTTETKI